MYMYVCMMYVCCIGVILSSFRKATHMYLQFRQVIDCVHMHSIYCVLSVYHNCMSSRTCIETPCVTALHWIASLV